MNTVLKTIALFSSILVISGCRTSSGVVPVGQDTYTVVKSSNTGFTAVGKLKSLACKEASEFAEHKGKVMEVISVNEIAAGLAKFPQVEVKFRLLDPDAVSEDEIRSIRQTEIAESYDSDGRRTTSTTEVKEIVPQGSRLDAPPQEDLYSELTKLDELLKKGLLNEEEFEAEKAKLLNRP